MSERIIGVCNKCGPSKFLQTPAERWICEPCYRKSEQTTGDPKRVDDPSVIEAYRLKRKMNAALELYECTKEDYKLAWPGSMNED